MIWAIRSVCAATVSNEKLAAIKAQTCSCEIWNAKYYSNDSCSHLHAGRRDRRRDRDRQEQEAECLNTSSNLECFVFTCRRSKGALLELWVTPWCFSFVPSHAFSFSLVRTPTLICVDSVCTIRLFPFISNIFFIVQLFLSVACSLCSD